MLAFDIRNTTRGPLPRVPFKKIAERMVPNGYSLSLVLCGDTLSRRLNREHRKKTYVPNVLSFEISKNDGELFINPHVARREARRFGIRFEDRVSHLFVHGILHLVGYEHGDRMDRKERDILRRFGYRAE